MIVDTSAVLAILFDEAEQSVFRETLLANAPVRMSVVSYVEAGMVALGRRVEGELDPLLDDLQIALVAVTVEQTRAALDAARRFGKKHHPAALNLGDCFAYALAKTADEPLLFKGDDFGQTDIRAAAPVS